MYSRVISGAVEGMEGQLVEVEADLGNGLPVFEMVGYLASEVKEAKERVRTALKNQGFVLPPKKITVNLSPADLRKSGSIYDLPVAVAVLIAGGLIPPPEEPMLFLGELRLDGTIKQVQGVLPVLLTAQQEGIRICIVPEGNQMEGSVAEGIFCIGISSLKEAGQFLTEFRNAKNRALLLEEWQKRHHCSVKKETISDELDFCEIKGQILAKRAIEIAVSGHHNLLMIGPPGSGKTALAKRIPTIMPKLTKKERLELTRIYSVKGLLEEGRAVTKRPFRAPHHTISSSAMAGGGKNAQPGEVSLADKGVLFLDEFPEYKKEVLEIMRQPLEEGKIVLSRNKRTCVYPADFLLAAAMNPCSCGYYPDRSRCSCNESQIRRYQQKISGPLLDRIDLTVRVDALSYEELRTAKEGETSGQIRERVEQVRERQRIRFQAEPYDVNARIDSKGLETFCRLSKEAEQKFQTWFQKSGLSARGYVRILKVARTIADMDEADLIEEKHLLEAFAYRTGVGE